MAYKDLREWLDKVDRMGELTRIYGADWDIEASVIASLTANMVLFDKFPGYPPGYRVLASYTRETLSRFFITANWHTEARGLALAKAFLDKLRQFQPVPPKRVPSGPIEENVISGNEVDLFKFPVLKRHELEGGRFIGTGHCVIMRDPDSGQVNLGTYRMMIHDKSTTGMHASEGKDGRIIMDKYLQRGIPCPVVAVVGIDPGLFWVSTSRITHHDGSTELDFAGWLKGQPEEVINGRLTGLPIPANAEIALEGEINPGEVKLEGPFIEWTGYSQIREIPVFKVKTIYHRDNPILTVSTGTDAHPPEEGELRWSLSTSVFIWDQLEKAGVRGICGVAAYVASRLIVVSLKNLYAGQSRQAGIIASQCHGGAYGGAYIIVVDEDIDPTNLNQVIWAVITRTEPERAIQILKYCWASHLSLQDPSHVQKRDYAMRSEKATYMSRVLIDACKPLEWDPTWHGDVRMSPEMVKKVKEKWGKSLPSAHEIRKKEKDEKPVDIWSTR